MKQLENTHQKKGERANTKLVHQNIYIYNLNQEYDILKHNWELGVSISGSIFVRVIIDTSHQHDGFHQSLPIGHGMSENTD